MNQPIFILSILSLFLSNCSLVISDPYSPEKISALIAKYNASKNETTLLEYAQQMQEKQMHREQGEPVAGSLPRELEAYLINLLQSGTQNDKRNIIKFYSKATNITSCCWQIATYKDKSIIGDILQIAKPLNDEDKLGALKVIESIRRDASLYKPELQNSKGAGTKAIEIVFMIYENWWFSSNKLKDKLKIDPLKKSEYKWLELE